MQVKLSSGNTKIGKIWSISLPPEETCPDCAPCKRVCYARQQYRQYPETHKAYDYNLAFYNSDPSGYFASLYFEFEKRKNKENFRFHISGDIPDQDYLTGILHFAHAFPKTRVMLYTKRIHSNPEWFENIIIPPNLSVCWSMWPKYGNVNALPTGHNIVWMRDQNGIEDRIPQNAVECSGKCDACLACYTATGANIVIDEHGHHIKRKRENK